MNNSKNFDFGSRKFSDWDWRAQLLMVMGFISTVTGSILLVLGYTALSATVLGGTGTKVCAYVMMYAGGLSMTFAPLLAAWYRAKSRRQQINSESLKI